MASPTPVSRYVHRNSKKRVLPGGSSSSVCKDVEVPEITTPVNRSSKTKSPRQKEVVYREIIDVDAEEDCDDVIIVEAQVDSNRKGKETAPNFSIGFGAVENDGSGSDAHPSNNGFLRQHGSTNIDHFNSSHFFGEDEYLDDYYDDIISDENALLESQFDHMDIPPGIEMPFPWLPSSPENKTIALGISTASKSNFQFKLDGVNTAPYYNSTNSLLPPSIHQVSDLPTSQSKSSIFTQENVDTHHLKKKVRYKVLESDLMEKKSSTSSSTYFLGSQSSMDPLTLKSGKESFHFSGNSERRNRACHVVCFGPPNQFASGVTYPATSANNTSGYPHLNLPLMAPARGTYVPHWQDLSMNILGPSAGSSEFMPEFAPWAQDAVNMQDGSSSTTSSVPTTIAPRDMVEILQNFEVFKKFDTAEDYSDHFYSKNVSSAKQPPKNWAKKIQEEWKILELDLPDTIFVRVYEARMDLLRAVIVGAEGTPYHDGLFFFDVFFPSSYPNVPPLVHYHSGGLRINPNLYKCGKVCLSLLNTWSGSHQEKWIPGVSTMLQVLVSIQGLILNAKPFFNEPGFANMFGSANGEKRSLKYNENTFIYSLQTMVYSMRRPPKNFEDFVMGHYCNYARDILVSCKAYVEGAQVGCLAKGGVQDVDEGDKSCSQNFKKCLAGFIPTLVNAFSQIGVKDCEEFLSLSQKSNGTTDVAPHVPQLGL